MINRIEIKTSITQPFKFFPEQVYNGILLVAVSVISNRRILACWLNRSCGYVNALADYILWGLIVFGAFLLLIQNGKIREYLLMWRMNWLLGLFILYSMASVSWSMAVDRSLHTAYIMVASSISGAIFAVIYTPKALLKNLLGFTLISGILSLLIVIIYPSIGIHQDPVWSGAWRGIFGHKNDFGPLMALGNGLVLLSLARSTGKRDVVINIFFYFVTLLLIIMSRSATALALWIILNGLTLLYFSWIKWRSKFQGKKYVYIASLSAAILGPLSLIAVILLMGKSFNLTGRVPLWVNLLKYVVSEKPWFGHGLETLWYIPEFQKWASNISGWGADVIIVVNGHNGYMDILLYLGVVGLAALCLVLIQGLVRAINRVLIGRAMLDFFPLLTLVYFLTANITTSYILEFEIFHWLVLVILLFLPPGRLSDQDSARN